ncbi:MAG: HEAT repeat domain-containing protein [Verrucomicrobia bacterium]|jgi:hypothetical protein|nr:HEAT repeat domain-containing protein [Verrucomicrobiota bacterium]
MNLSFQSTLFLSFVAFSVLSTGLRAETVEPLKLRYVFAPDTTNAYSLQIENRGESGKEIVAGNFLLTSRRIGSNLFSLSFRGQLRPKPIPGQPPMMNFYRPGYPTPMSSYLSRFTGEPMELVVDDSGVVVRQAGDMTLPAPLGQLMLSLVEPFPADAASGWDSEREVNVLDDPLVQGPATIFLNSVPNYGGYYPGRAAQGVLSARQKTKFRVTAVTPESVTLQKTLALDSRMLTGNEPRISASGEGQIVFDRKVGVPKHVELQCKTLVVTDNVTRRSGITFRWELLDGTEREAVVNPPPPRPAESVKLSPDELAKLVEKIKSDDTEARLSAARQLTSSRIESPSAELISLMAGLAGDRDDTVRSAALTLLANHGAHDHVPLLVKALGTTDSGLRSTIIRGLGRLKDKRSAEALAELVATGPGEQLQYNSSRNTEAADALARIGPVAEPAVLALLKEKSNQTRWQACGILKQIGTKKSLPGLKELTLVPSKELGETAADACRAIQARETN